MSDEQRPHHDFSPSQLQSLEACPCYQSKQSKVLHPRTIIGTISHGVTETGEDDAHLSDEDTDKVAECIDFYEQRKQHFQAQRAKAIEQFSAGHYGERVPPGGEEEAQRRAELAFLPVLELKETYLPVDDLAFVDVLNGVYGDGKTSRYVRATTAGYIDCALINHDRTYAEIFDWKFGFWAVEQAKNNLQGIAYALGMFKRYPDLESVKYFFKQPNLDYVTHATIHRKDIPAHYLRIQVVVARAREARKLGDFSTARPMVPACNFCTHIGKCPLVTGLACRVGAKFYPLEIPSDITPTMVHSPTDTKLGLRLASVLEVWAKAYRNTITNRVLCMQAEVPEGYALESRTPREIADPAKYKETALRYLTPEEYDATLKPSLGKVKEKISEKAPRGQKTAAIELFSKEAEDSGAIERGESYTFLKVKPTKPKE